MDKKESYKSISYWWHDPMKTKTMDKCPKCNSTKVYYHGMAIGTGWFKCRGCNYVFTILKQDRPDKAALVPKEKSTAQGEHRDKSADQADPV